MFTDACTTYSDYFLYSAMKKVDSIFFKAQETERLVTHRCAPGRGWSPKEHTFGS